MKMSTTEGEVVIHKPRARSTPSSHEHGKRKSGSGGGIELKVFEVKSCEALRNQREHFSGKLSRQALYREALYTGTHMLGKPSSRFPSSQEDIMTYVQVCFAKNIQEQMDFIEHVTAEPFPLTIVNVGIRRGENLAPRDRNGLSDPYCLISVETEDSMNKAAWRQMDFGSPVKPKVVKIPKDRERAVAEQRFDQVYSSVPRSIRTSIQHQTLNPVWEERFQCLALRPSLDILHLEVWDHDDEEEVLKSLQGATNIPKTEKVEEGLEILNEGFRRGKRDDFIGKATYKITEIPVEGEERWFYLQGKTHRGVEAQGKILIQIWLTHSYRHGVHYMPEASPRVVLEKLWDYVLDNEAQRRSVAGEEWDSDIPHAATCLLFQYGLQTGLSESTQAIVRFNAYAKRHLKIHGAELRLKELDHSMKKTEGIPQESAHAKVDTHCDTEEILSSLLKTLQGPFGVIRHHFLEKPEKVGEALKSIRHVENILTRMGAQEQLTNLDTELKVSLRFGIQDWYQERRKEYVRGPPDQDRAQVICGHAQVVGLLNRKLIEGQRRWEPLFAMESNLEYLPVLYDELQKVIVNDVEGVTSGLVKEIGDNDQQRRILLRMSREHQALCMCLFELYAQTHVFVQFQEKVFHKSLGRRKFYHHLDEFHEWFRPVLILWLGFAFIKAHNIIAVSINSDEIHADDDALRSYSSYETGFVFHQLANFSKELSWPDPAESSVVNMFLVEVMTYISILYARLKRRKIDREGYFDTVDQFDISERLCTALNNIHYVQVTVQKMPKELLIDALLEALSETVGEKSKTLEICHSRIVQSLVTAVNQIELEIQAVLAGIAHRIKPEVWIPIFQGRKANFVIRSAWDAVVLLIEASPNANDPLQPLMQYLEGNLQLLHRYLYHENFVRMLHIFWTVICQELAKAVMAAPITSTTAQHLYFRSFQHILPQLIDYLKGNGEGLKEIHLQLPQFKFVSKLLHLFTLPSDEVTNEYFYDRAAEQLLLKGQGPLGTLRIRVSAAERKLHVEVISAKNLIPVEHPSPLWDVCSKIRAPSSDPQVELDLIVQSRSTGSVRKTKAYKHDLHPTFGENFEFFWDKDGLELTSWKAVILRLTMKDVDILSGNDFMGEALVPLDRMPGVAQEKLQVQPMNLQLRQSGDITQNPYLMVLNSRKWEPDTRDFVSEQMKRQVVV